MDRVLFAQGMPPKAWFRRREPGKSEAHCHYSQQSVDDIEYQDHPHTDVPDQGSFLTVGHRYEVDVLAYSTCTCSDLPVSKHLHAVQTLFPLSDLCSSAQLDNLSTGSELQVPSDKRNIGLRLSVDTEDSTAALNVGSELDTETPAVLRSVAEKAEHFVARFRLRGTLEQAKRLEAWIDQD